MASMQGHVQGLCRNAHSVSVSPASFMRPQLGIRAAQLRHTTAGCSRSLQHPCRPRSAAFIACKATVSDGGGAGGGGAAGGSGGGGGGGSGDSAGQPHPMQLWSYLYAALLAAGGIMAYVKKASSKSLTAAGGSALIVSLAARNMVGSAARSSIIVALAVSVALTVVMGGRYQRTRKFMPAGLAAVSSLAMSAGYLATGF